MDYLELLLISAIAIFCLYKWLTWNYDFFDKRNIPYEKPFLLFGNMKEMLTKTEIMYDTLIRLHKKFNTKQVYGIFEMRTPFIVINDFEILKNITVKDFDHFMNRRTLIEERDDKLFGNIIVNMKDQKWKHMRSTLNAGFTDSKISFMYHLIRDCSKQSINYLKDQSNKYGDIIHLNMKQYFTRYTNDVVASTAYGLKINSFTDQQNLFYLMGRKITNFTDWALFKLLLFGWFTTIMRIFKVRLFDEKLTKYFISLVLDTIKYREAHDIVRQDMINMLMEERNSNSTKKYHNREWSDAEIAAQCLVFFTAGFETTTQLMCFASHELMQNPDIQQKLFEEIQQVKAELKGKPLSYEKLQGMKYLDNVVSETLRKWPGPLTTDRVCTKPYQLKIQNNIIDLKVGDIISINIAGMHHDPNNFPNPENFDPDRFNDQNRNNFNTYAYAPFGFGPRNCVGNRFALLEAKSMLYDLVSEFEFTFSMKLRVPIQLEGVGFAIQPKGGFWVKLVPREYNILLQ